MINENNCSLGTFKKVSNVFSHIITSADQKINDLRVKHLACAVRNNTIISPIMINHSRYMTHKKVTGTSHAEMGVVRYLCDKGELNQCILCTFTGEK